MLVLGYHQKDLNLKKKKEKRKEEKQQVFFEGRGICKHEILIIIIIIMFLRKLKVDCI